VRALALVFALAACASPKPCPPPPIVPRPPEEPPPKPRLEPATAGVRASAVAALRPSVFGHKPKFLGCDIRYHHAPPGSSILLRWFVYENVQGYEDNEPINETAGKHQAVKGDGVINAYLQSLDSEFAPAIYVCDFALMYDDKELVPHERATIWVDPPAPAK
jgi:hypothetical protein